MIRAVIDTNVLVSGLLSPNGNAALVLLAVQQGLVHPCFSDAILDEYTAVLGRPRFGFSPEEIDALLLMFRTKGEFFQPDASPIRSPDPADTKFIHCALAANADYLVTGNKRDFPDASYGSTRVVNVAELIDQVTLEI
ncbi:MAG: putative toxin-antitoxin system toxin component, PIN family [Pseudomonadota bacterium]|nr:putative toxin-antitoxin system toxin component, PIN family [Pseudomonadota bacterium]